MMKIKEKIKNIVYSTPGVGWRIASIFIIAIIIVIGLIYVFNKPVPVQATWWNDTWSYRQSITVTNGSGGELTDFQVKILDSVDLSSLVTAGKLQASLADLRFTDINHRVLSYWIEDTTNSAVIAWVKVPSIPTTGTTIYMYYGNASAVDAQDGDQTFEFFDDFSGSSLDESKWTIHGNSYGTITVSGGELTLSNTSGNVANILGIHSVQTAVTTSRAIFTKSKNTTGRHSAIIGFADDPYKPYPHGDATTDGVTLYSRADITTATCSIANGANTSSVAPTDQNYTSYQILNLDWISSSSVKIYKDGVEECAFTDSATIPSGSFPVIYSSDGWFNPDVAVIDWVFVKKISSAEPAVTSPSTEENAPGPVLYLNFSEGFGTTAYDNTGYGNDCSLAGGTTWAKNGKSGDAINFDGVVGTYLNCGSDASLGITDAITISAWVKPNSSLSSLDRIYTGNGEGFGTNAVNQAWFYIDGTYRYSPSVSAYVTTDQWNHWLTTYDSSTHDIKIYINGVLKGTTTLSGLGSYTIRSTSNQLYIGTNSTTGDRVFNGLIDEVRIYDRALSASEVKQLYNQNTGSFNVGQSGIPTSCADQLAKNPSSQSGVYTIDPGYGVDPFDVYCDMETDGGGWTLVSKFSQHQAINSLPQATYDNYFKNNLWIKGTAEAIPSTPIPSYDDYHIESLDWRNIMESGNQYQLRQTVFKNTDTHKFDVSYDFTYNGYVSQNDAPTDNDKKLVLTNRNVITDNSGISWETADPETLFWLPFQPGYTGSVYTACGSYRFDTDGCGATGVAGRRYGNAGIVQNSADGLDPAISWGPHTNSSTTYDIAYEHNNNTIFGLTGSPMTLMYWIRDLNIVQSPGVALDLPFESVSGSTTYDISGNANNGTITGAIQRGAANCKVGKCFEFDGTDNINSMSVDSWIRDIDDVTITGWYYHDAVTAGAPWGILTNTDPINTADGFWWHLNLSGNFYLRTEDNTHGESDGTGTPFVALDTWYYLTTIVGENKFDVYVNGLLYWSWTPTNSFSWSSINSDTAYFQLGMSYSTSINGKLDEIKLFDRALTQREIIMEMNSGKSQPVLDLSFDEGGGSTVYDKSGFGNDGTITSATWKIAENCVSGSCLSFAGSNYLTANDSSLDVNNNYSILAWFKYTSASAGHGIVEWGEEATGKRRGMIIYNGGSGSNFYLYSSSFGSNIPGATVLSSDTWYHGAVTVDDSGSATIYLNGVLDGTGTNTLNTYTYGGTNIGRTAYPEYWNGDIDEVKIYPYVLTPQEIKQDYIQSAGQFGSTNSVGEKTTPGASCADIHSKNTKLPDGVYWIDTTGGAISDAFQVYCDMTTDGGGWTLIMQTSSSSAYTYADTVWTNTSGGSTSAGNPNVNQDYVSTAFYTLSGTESRLALGDQSYWNSWTHSSNNARNLANQTRMTGAQGSADNCTAQTNCGTEPINLKPQGIEQGTSGTTAGAWHRFGYVNDSNSWGPQVRVGFSGDNDSSDSSDTVMGLGLNCQGYCASHCSTAPSHNTGSGYYLYATWGTVPLDDAKQGWLWIRDAGTNTISTGPVLDMDFDQYVGGVYLDRSGNGVSGTPGGDPTWKTTVNCKSGRCVELDGNDYINWGGSIDNGTTTVTTWFNSTYLSIQDVFNFRNGDAQGGFYFNYSASKPLLYLNGENYRYWSTTANDYLDGNWHFLELYIPGSAQLDITNTVLRIDNNTIPASTTSSSSTTQQVWTNFWVGDDTPGFRGSIDDMKVFNRALTRAEVANLYNGGQPVGWWRLDEGADNLCSDGKDTCDNSGEGNNGTIGGTVTWVNDAVSCKQGGCMDFDGSSGYVDIIHGGDLSYTSELSVSTWFKHDTASGTDSMVTRLGTGGSDNFNLYFSATSLTFGMRDSGCSTWQSISKALSDVSNWHHAMATYDGSYSRLYLDGELQATSSSTFSVCTSPISNMRIGAGAVTPSTFFDGKLDDVRIYNYVLTDKQVKEVYNGGLIRFK